jgi:uncharacterized protein (TIGR02246 family)
MADRPEDAIREHLQELSDKLAIRELTALYNRTFDDADGDTYAATFTDDGVLAVVGGPVLTGRDELRRFAGEWKGTVHATTDATIVVTGDTATQVCTLILGTRSEPDARAGWGGMGRYTDELVRTPEGWRFRRRTAVLGR